METEFGRQWKRKETQYFVVVAVVVFTSWYWLVVCFYSIHMCKSVPIGLVRISLWSTIIQTTHRLSAQ